MEIDDDDEDDFIEEDKPKTATKPKAKTTPKAKSETAKKPAVKKEKKVKDEDDDGEKKPAFKSVQLLHTSYSCADEVVGEPLRLLKPLDREHPDQRKYLKVHQIVLPIWHLYLLESY